MGNSARIKDKGREKIKENRQKRSNQDAVVRVAYCQDDSVFWFLCVVRGRC